MDDALKAADAVLEHVGPDSLIELAPVVPAIGGSTQHGEVLNDGSYRGLVLQRDIVMLVQRELDVAMAAGAGAAMTVGKDGEPSVPTALIDVKLLRAGNEAARDLTRLAVRVAEGAFKAQQGNQLVALLEQLKAAQEKKRG
jgi:hypothetical protein